MNRSMLCELLLAAVLASGAGGCVMVPAHTHDPGYGPPPHAPAHGYRAKYHEHELVFDAGLGVYVVVGLPEVYFLDGVYLRYGDGHWHHSKHADRDWEPHDDRKLPPGLAKKHPGKGKPGRKG